MAIHENIITPEVKANGYGGIEADRFAHALEQIALAHKFKAKPKLDDIFEFVVPAGGGGPQIQLSPKSRYLMRSRILT